MKTVEQLKRDIEIKEAQKAAIFAALMEIQNAHELVLKQYEDAIAAVNDAKLEYTKAIEASL